MNTVNKPFRKKDAMQLVTGQPVYMDDVIPQEAPVTVCSSTAMSALWAMWWPLWPARTKNAWTRLSN